MAKKAQVRVAGVAEVQRALKSMERSTAEMTDTHRKVVSSILPGVASRTPRRSGALASSYAAGATKTRGKVLSPLVYAGPIEWGHESRNIIGAHMVRDTIEAEQPAIIAGYEAELEAAGRKAGFETQ